MTSSDEVDTNVSKIIIGINSIVQYESDDFEYSVDCNIEEQKINVEKFIESIKTNYFYNNYKNNIN